MWENQFVLATVHHLYCSENRFYFFSIIQSIAYRLPLVTIYVERMLPRTSSKHRFHLKSISIQADFLFKAEKWNFVQLEYKLWFGTKKNIVYSLRRLTTLEKANFYVEPFEMCSICI